MPRDISGNYTLPLGNPVVHDTLIDASWANSTLSDLAVQLNNVITRDGVLGATQPIKFASGAAVAPGLAFTADPQMGMYRAGAGILGFATNAVSRLTISATGNLALAAPTSGNHTIGGTTAANGSLFTALNASELASGTVPDARFPATLPALSGLNLTALNASNLGSGTVPDARFPAALPAVSGASLTALNASNLGSGTVPDARFPATLPALSGLNLTALNASNLGSGTVPDARFPATLPALSGVNLTALNASNLGSGTVPAARITSVSSGTTDGTNELGYKGLPSASVTTGAFAASDKGKCVYATAGVTIPNSTMAAGDTVIVQNTTGAGVTITKTVTTAYNTTTGSALGATFTLGARGRMAIVFTSATECYVSGNIS